MWTEVLFPTIVSFREEGIILVEEQSNFDKEAIEQPLGFNGNCDVSVADVETLLFKMFLSALVHK